MTKISSENTPVIRMLPYLYTVLVILFTILIIHEQLYIALIFTPFVLVIMIATKFYHSVRALQDVFIDFDLGYFKVIKKKNELHLPFSELKKVKRRSGGMIVELIFNNKIHIFFFPINGKFSIANDHLIRQIKSIVKK